MPHTNCFQRRRHFRHIFIVCCESKARATSSVYAFEVKVSRLTPTQTAKRNERGGQCGNPSVEGVTKSHTLLTFGNKVVVLPLLPPPSFLMVALRAGHVELGDVSSDSKSTPSCVEIREHLAPIVFHFRQKQPFCFPEVPKLLIS